MRKPATVALVFLAGVHCSAPPYAGEDVATDEPAAGSTEEPSGRAGAERVSGTEPAPGGEKDDPRWAINAQGLPPTVFTTTVRGDDGALYAAGTFAGWLTLGEDTLKSKGADDVVLVRVDANGHIAWVKSIGSIVQERAPKVTFSEGKVRILAETDGQVDCGSGDMGKWSSGMFFYCLYDIDGTALGGGAFPTGAP
jgi:hypothetical protein